MFEDDVESVEKRYELAQHLLELLSLEQVLRELIPLLHALHVILKLFTQILPNSVVSAEPQLVKQSLDGTLALPKLGLALLYLNALLTVLPL